MINAYPLQFESENLSLFSLCHITAVICNNSVYSQRLWRAKNSRTSSKHI